MINIEIFRNSSGDVYKFLVKGHAGFDVYNRDIVCAGITALAETAALGIESLKSVLIHKDIKSGYMSVEIVDMGLHDDNIRLKAIIETMILGFKDIERDYSKYVKVVDRRC